MIRVDDLAYFFAALILLTVPLEWVVSILVAAVFHELCHCFAVRLCGGSIKAVTIGIGGAVMEAEIFGSGKELICTAAGPMGSLSLLFLCHMIPKVAICGLIQGIVNLLPVYPLDGGRILKCVLIRMGSQRPERILRLVTGVTYLLIAIAAVFLTGILPLGQLPLFLGGIWILKGILRKRPCKRSRIRVQ